MKKLVQCGKRVVLSGLGLAGSVAPALAADFDPGTVTVSTSGVFTIGIAIIGALAAIWGAKKAIAFFR